MSDREEREERGRRLEAREDERFQRAAGKAEERRLLARRRRDRNVWFWLGMFGLVGWSVAVPTLIGVALGVWLDRRGGNQPFSWTLSLLALGVLVGCVVAYYWVRKEYRRR